MKVYIVTPQYIISEAVLKLSLEATESFKNTADVIFISCDDCSPMGSDELKKHADVYLKTPENGGFAKTCNIGFKWILENEPDDCLVVCANNDILVYPGWLDEFKKLIIDFKADMVGGLGFREKNIYGRSIDEYSTNPGSRYQDRYISEGGRLDDWLFPGGFWIMKKSVLTDVGILDENFKHGGYEDIDFFYRAKLAGKKLIMTPKVHYWHQEGATRFSDTEKGRQNEAEPENRAHFKQKHGFDAIAKLNNILTDNRINL